MHSIFLFFFDLFLASYSKVLTIMHVNHEDVIIIMISNLCHPKMFGMKCMKDHLQCWAISKHKCLLCFLDLLMGFHWVLISFLICLTREIANASLHL